MATYYDGNLDQDLLAIQDLKCIKNLTDLCEYIGYGRFQQICEYAKKEVAVQVDAAQLLYAYSLIKEHGYERLIWIIQVLWAKKLRVIGMPLNGALGHPIYPSH